VNNRIVLHEGFLSKICRNGAVMRWYYFLFSDGLFCTEKLSDLSGKRYDKTHHPKSCANRFRKRLEYHRGPCLRVVALTRLR
jgi:hypothetical protein